MITPAEVKALRLSNRMTQDAFGALADVSGRQVRKWESDEPGTPDCPPAKWELLQSKLSGEQTSNAYIVGRIFGLLDLFKPMSESEIAQCDIYPAKYFALVYRTRKLPPEYDLPLASLMEELENFPEGPMPDEQKSHFWLGWHHQRRDMRKEKAPSPQR